MAWLIGWNRRKSITIYGNTTSPQTDYQMKFTLHKSSGTDTSSDIYLGLNVRNDFGDVRFTSSDGTTLLPYWIESYILGVSAIVWVKIDSILASPFSNNIWIYYENLSQTTTSNVVTTFIRTVDNVIGAWRFDESSGLATIDYSGNNHVGTLYNFLPPTWVTGKFGNALLFGGSSYVDIGSMGIPNENYAFSLDAWINSSSFSGYPHIFSNGNSGLGQAGKFSIFLRFNTDGTIVFGINRAQYWDLYKITTFAFNINTWYHIVATYDGSKTLAGENIYVNGIPQSTTNYGSVGSASVGFDSWNIGHIWGSANYFNGIIDEPRIYNRALAQTEISDIYNNYGYVTTNYAGKELVRKYVSPEPTWSTSAEQIYTANLTVSSTPSGAEIWINNVYRGVTTGWFILDPGTYAIMLTKPGYEDYIYITTLESNVNAIVHGDLIPIGCTTITKYSGDTITLQATPKDGIGPYYVVFRKNGVTIDPSRLDGLSNPIPSIPENTLITRIYTLDDVDIAGASGGTINFSVYMTDSCPTGPVSCTETCTITIGCVAPVCNFTVT